MCAVIAAGLSWRLFGAASVRFHRRGEGGEYGRPWRCCCAPSLSACYCSRSWRTKFCLPRRGELGAHWRGSDGWRRSQAGTVRVRLADNLNLTPETVSEPCQPAPLRSALLARRVATSVAIIRFLQQRLFPSTEPSCPVVGKQQETQEESCRWRTACFSPPLPSSSSVFACLARCRPPCAR